MRLPDVVTQKLDALPASPGVYVFFDRKGGVLYVGKARSLKSRVRSYFQPGQSDTRFFVERLEREIGDLETFVAKNEKEAALLENALIKERKPRYNFKLRDDKDFLSLRLDPREAWPRLTVLRRPRPDGAWYFGPYDSATSARRTLRTVNRFFKLRTCRDTDFARRVRPCLQYQIKRCAGPCVFDDGTSDFGSRSPTDLIRAPLASGCPLLSTLDRRSTSPPPPGRSTSSFPAANGVASVALGGISCRGLLRRKLGPPLAHTMSASGIARTS